MTGGKWGDDEPGRRPESRGDIDCLYLSSGAGDYVPRYYAQVRIDFSDVRTGFRASIDLAKAVDLSTGAAELPWVDDMTVDVDPSRIGTSLPEGALPRPLPAFVDAPFLSLMETQCVRYLLRSFAVCIYRNSELGVWSASGEAVPEFVARCLELAEGPMRGELDRLRDRYNRRFEQLREKYALASGSEDLAEARLQSRSRDLFSRFSERIAGLFLRGDLPPLPAAASPTRTAGSEQEERLRGLEGDARREVAALRAQYEEKAGALDEYRLHPNLKDIHFVRSGVLWMLRGA
ncbi:MAG: hypothetical protein JXP48_08470 [Acidobacteria bacterium]|nr:hypothetical protein [Acidobacteriota bacterium]